MKVTGIVPRGYGTLTVAEPLILKNVDYNVIFLSNFLF